MTRKITIIASQFAARFVNSLYKHTFFLRHKKSHTRSLRILASDNPGHIRLLRKSFGKTNHSINFATFDINSITDFDIHIPFYRDDMNVASKLQESSHKTILSYPCEDVVNLCDDKVAFNNRLMELGYSSNLPSLPKADEFPYFLKKRQDEYGENCHFIDSKDSQQKFQHLLTDEAYFLQSAILGSSEFALHILFIYGELKYALNIRYKFQSDSSIKGKSDSLYESIWPCHSLDLFESILKDIKYEGLGCFNYKFENGEPKILELNPRCGGSLTPYLGKLVDYIF